MSAYRNISTCTVDTDLLFCWRQNHKEKLCVWWDCNRMKGFTSPPSSSCQDLTLSHCLSSILRTPSLLMNCLYTLVFPALLGVTVTDPPENLYGTSPMESREAEVCLCRISLCQIQFDWNGFSLCAPTPRGITQRTHFCVTCDNVCLSVPIHDFFLYVI
jgi:hypothetical protein